MTPPSPIRTNSDGTIPMGPIHTTMTAERFGEAERIASSPLRGRAPVSHFVPSSLGFDEATSGHGGRRGSHESRASGSGGHRPSPSLGMEMSIHSGTGFHSTLVESPAPEGPLDLPSGSSRRPAGPRARLEATLARARDHYNTGVIDSRIGSVSASTRAGEEFSSARSDLRAAWQIFRNNPGLLRDESLRSEYRDLRSRMISTAIDRDLSSAGI